MLRIDWSTWKGVLTDRPQNIIKVLTLVKKTPSLITTFLLRRKRCQTIVLWAKKIDRYFGVNWLKWWRGMSFILQYFSFSGNKKGWCGIIFFVTNDLIYSYEHRCILRINCVTHLAFYEYDKNFGVFTLWSQVNGRIGRYEFSNKSKVT